MEILILKKKKTNTVTEMKNAFDGPIRRLDTAGEKKIYELGYINRNPKTKKVKRKKTENS